MHHIPRDFATSSQPRVFPNRFVTFNSDVVFALSSQITVVFSCGKHQLRVVRQTVSSLFHNGKCFGQNVAQNTFEGVVAVFAERIHLFEKVFFFVQVFRFNGQRLHFSDFSINVGKIIGNAFAKFKGFCAQFIAA